MSYTPTNWQTGDTITAEKLNQIEEELEQSDTYVVPLFNDGGGWYTNPTDFDRDRAFATHSVILTFTMGGEEIGGIEAQRRNFGETFDLEFTVFFDLNNMEYSDVPYTYMLNTDNIEEGQLWYLQWASHEAPPFVVTLTPEAQDFSGTMDYTVSEIYDAYQQGRRIIFRVEQDGVGAFEIEGYNVGYAVGYSYPSFNITFFYGDMHAFVFAATGVTDLADKNTYATTIYPLTPM